MIAGNAAKLDTHDTFHVYGRGSIYVVNSTTWLTITLISIVQGTSMRLNVFGEVTPQLAFTIAFVCMSVGSAIKILRFTYTLRKEET